MEKTKEEAKWKDKAAVRLMATLLITMKGAPYSKIAAESYVIAEAMWQARYEHFKPYNFQKPKDYAETK